MYLVRPRLLLVPCAAAILAIGCGQSSLSPTGPSGVPGSTALSTGDSVLASTSDTFSALGRGGGGGGNNGGGGNSGGGNGNGNGKEKGGDESLRSEEHTSELQSPCNLVCRLLLEKKKPRGRQLRLRS